MLLCCRVSFAEGVPFQVHAVLGFITGFASWLRLFSALMADLISGMCLIFFLVCCTLAERQAHIVTHFIAIVRCVLSLPPEQGCSSAKFTE